MSRVLALPAACLHPLDPGDPSVCPRDGPRRRALASHDETTSIWFDASRPFKTSRLCKSSALIAADLERLRASLLTHPVLVSSPAGWKNPRVSPAAQCCSLFAPRCWSGLSERLLRCLSAEREKPNVPKREIMSNIKLKRAKFKFPSWENMFFFWHWSCSYK